MKSSYVKSKKEYEETSLLDAENILEAMKRVKGRRKPTSVALEDSVIRELKKVAEQLNLPYQVLVRLFILDGLRRVRDVA
jgi:predicted DNA-binding ribbon-helix-helix protein